MRAFLAKMQASDIEPDTKRAHQQSGKYSGQQSRGSGDHEPNAEHAVVADAHPDAHDQEHGGAGAGDHQVLAEEAQEEQSLSEAEAAVTES